MEANLTTSSSTSSTVSDEILMDDVVKFSLPALVSLVSDFLFESEVDRKFLKAFFEDVIKQLCLEDKTRNSVDVFVNRNISSPAVEKNKNPHIDPLVDSIRRKLWISNSGNENGSEGDVAAKDDWPEDSQLKNSDSSEQHFSEGSETPLKLTPKSPLNSELREDLAIAVVSCLVATALGKGRYDARVRIVIRYIVYKLWLKWEMVEEVEDSLVEHFREAKVVQTEEDKKEQARSSKIAKIKRIGAISAAAVIGGVAIGVTGGLAAPAIIGAMGGAVAAGGFGAFIASTAGAAIIGSLFGAAGAGLSGYKMKRRVGDVEEFEFVPLTDGQQLHLAVALPGWLSSEQPDCRNAYYTLSIAREQYCLKFESRFLIELGNALDYFLNIATSGATSSLAQEIAKSSASGGLQLLIAWPSLLLNVANVIDNPWGVCLRRSAKAGEHLAGVLLRRQQGHRPVTLIGFSLGARAIFYCLREMARDKYSSKAGGIIQNVILLGAPVTAQPQEWSKFSNVISGEIVNGYSNTDWLLKFLYRSTSANTKIAGLGPVEWDNRRMFNMDLSHIIGGHGDYLHKMDLVLSELGIGDRKKATLMSLADTRLHMAASVSNTQIASNKKSSDAVVKQSTSLLALEQLQLAEKLVSEDENADEGDSHSKTFDSAQEAIELDN